MQANEIVEKIVAAVQEMPEVAQKLICDPKGEVDAIVGDAGDFDINAVLQGVLARAAELGLDFSAVDLSKLDLAQLDVSKLDLGALKDAASKLNVDVSKLDLSKMDLSGALRGLFGGLGGILGK